MEEQIHITSALKALRKRAGFSIRQATKAIGMSGTSYQRFEDPKRFEEPSLKRDYALRLAEAYEGLGSPPITKVEVLEAAGYDEFKEAYAISDALSAPVTGSAQAGSFVDFLSTHPPKIIPITSDERYPDSTPRFCISIIGEDAGDNFPVGGYAVCIGTEHLQGEIENGKYVVVHQRKAGLTEITIKKKIVKKDGTVWLLSADPKIEPIPYLSKDVEIKGLVISVEITL